MTDSALSQAIREAYASAPPEVIWHTLEIWHPHFTVPIRVVRDFVSLDARLEASAQRDAGQMVTFVAFAFDLVPPDQQASGLPQCVIEIDNVSRDILAQLDLAVGDPRPVEVIYRAYLEGRQHLGPETDPPLALSLLSVSATPLRIRATAGFHDLVNRRFPAQDYTSDRFPGLILR